MEKKYLKPESKVVELMLMDRILVGSGSTPSGGEEIPGEGPGE